MKLYTEEQVKQIWKAGQEYWKTSGASITMEELLEKMTPIELPSDEEMANASNHCKDGQVKVGFLRGVLWYQEQILKQNVPELRNADGTYGQWGTSGI